MYTFIAPFSLFDLYLYVFVFHCSFHLSILKTGQDFPFKYNFVTTVQQHLRLIRNEVLWNVILENISIMYTIVHNQVKCSFENNTQVE